MSLFLILQATIVLTLETSMEATKLLKVILETISRTYKLATKLGQLSMNNLATTRHLKLNSLEKLELKQSRKEVVSREMPLTLWV
jgi:hypothetical protein